MTTTQSIAAHASGTGARGQNDINLWLNKCHFGDVRDVLRRMIADGVKVNTIVTSPPYWGLRSYLPADHPDKPREIGSEPTLREFLDAMVQVFNLCHEVLRDDGTMWVNMGDSYTSGGRATWRSGASENKGHDVQDDQPRPNTPAGLKSKDLMGQPWRLAFALQDAGWYLRQDIIWSKPNPMPESTRDRCTKAHEYIFLLAKSEKYYFDNGAISEASNPDWKSRYESDFTGRPDLVMPDGKVQGIAMAGKREWKETRNKRSVWTVATTPYSGAHFATFPTKLIEPCILAGAPAGGVVLDPFFGSGTTGQVAQALGRQYIGCELNPAYKDLQDARTCQPSLDLEAA